MAVFPSPGILTIETPLPDVLMLEHLEGREAVSELFHFDLQLLGDTRYPVKFSDMLGQPITISLSVAERQKRYWNGIICEFRQGLEGSGLQGVHSIRYYATMAPKVWLWTRQVRSRIFQNLTVPEILAQVLTGVTVDTTGVAGAFPKRAYCVQYREADFDFASRLMEEEGIYYYFRHDATSHALVLANDNAAFANFADPPTATLIDPTRVNADWVWTQQLIRRWDKSQQVIAKTRTSWDQFFQITEKNLVQSKPIPDTVTVGGVTHTLAAPGSDTLEVYDYSGRYASRFDRIAANADDIGDQTKAITDEEGRIIKLLMEEHAVQSLHVSGESNVRGLAAGHAMKLTAPTDKAGKYLVTAVEHLASQSMSASPAERRKYSNRFRCIPSGLTYRPARRTPRPVIHSQQTAIVVGPTGQDIFTDSFGRVRVQFYWDRDGSHGQKGKDKQEFVTLQYWKKDKDTTSSAWVRVAQPWAGRGWGQVSIPRIGQEVVVGFLEGDPDQPIVVGSVYNSANTVPFTLPTNAATSGWKSHIPGGNDQAYSGIAIDDDKQTVQVHGQTKAMVTAKTDLILAALGSIKQIAKGKISTYIGDSGLSGFGEPTPPETNKPWEWKIEGLSSKIGKEFNLIYGEKAEAVNGWALSWVLGGKIDFIFSPMTILQACCPPLAMMLAPYTATIAGIQKYVFGPQHELFYNTKSAVMFGPDAKVELNDLDPLDIPGRKVLKILINLYVVLHIIEMLALGGAGSEAAKDWKNKDDPTKDDHTGGNWAFTGIGLMSIIAAAIVIISAHIVRKSKGMEKTLEALDEIKGVNDIALFTFFSSAWAALTTRQANPEEVQWVDV